MQASSREMCLFNRRKGRVAGTMDNSSTLVGSGIKTEKTFARSEKDPDSSTPDVNNYAKGGVSFSDTMLTERASFKARQQQQQQQDNAGSPAGPEASTTEEGGMWKTATETAQRTAATLLPLGTAQRAQTDGQREEQQQPSAVEATKGAGTEKELFLNEEELLSHSTFTIPPEQLVDMAKDVLRAGVHKCGKLSADFSFSAPFIGPLKSQDFAKTMETLSLDSVFPDLAPRIYHLRVDPLQPNRVWFTTRPIGTHTGYLTAKLPIPVKPTGKVVELPPQTSSLTFNEKGEVEDFTMGYVMDRRLGNTGGLGGAFGLLYAIGCPFPYPEGHPWESSWQQRLFNTGNPLLQMAMFTLDRLAAFFLPNFIYSSHSRNMP